MDYVVLPMAVPSEYFLHRGVPYLVEYESEGARPWVVFRDGLPRLTGQVIRTSQISSFRHAIAAAEAVIDAVEDSRVALTSDQITKGYI